MYTSDIENLQRRSMLELRHRQVADIDFVKNSKQLEITVKSDLRQPPWTTTHAADRRGGRQCR